MPLLVSSDWVGRENAPILTCGDVHPDGYSIDRSDIGRPTCLPLSIFPVLDDVCDGVLDLVWSPVLGEGVSAAHPVVAPHVAAPVHHVWFAVVPGVCCAGAGWVLHPVVIAPLLPTVPGNITVEDVVPFLGAQLDAVGVVPAVWCGWLLWWKLEAVAVGIRRQPEGKVAAVFLLILQTQSVVSHMPAVLDTRP